jgi:von Willebrand factor type A domain
VAESSESESPKSTWDRVAVPVIIGVTVSLITAGIIAFVSNLTTQEPVRVNVGLILDTSKGMGQEFGESTRFRAAIVELVKYVEPRDAQNLALWTSGGSCEPESTERVVPFAQNNSDPIKAALRELEPPRGESNLSDAIVTATGSFSDPDQFPVDVQKHIFVFTAGKDTCQAGLVGNIESRLREVGEDINVGLHLFALKVPSKLEQGLRRLEHELPDQVATFFPDTPKELGKDIVVAAAGINPPTPTPIPGPTSP